MAKKEKGEKDNLELPFAAGAEADEAPALPETDSGSDLLHVDQMFSRWFLEYASYVILERAVPHVNDGLKPVQRRILHSMWEMEDGRYNKVANVIGNTMKFHPHGDASIGDAMVQVGQKDLLIDMQGNWGNLHTGDSAAAPRYIEARLSKFALEVVFNPKTTVWQSSYDGRNKEPVTLPMKFPLLLAQGAEGIAVGLACKILPHNFCELIEASIEVLRGNPTNILPDFPTGGLMDAGDYNGGLRGGKIRVRARIEIVKRNLLRVDEVPFGTTTTGLIDSIVAANEKGKIKIAKIEDNTADKVEILIHLPSGADTEQTLNALYVFTDCEVSISPNSCVIDISKPRFLDVNVLLKYSADYTRYLLKRELEIQMDELEDKWHFSSLEKIFIENRIYRRIEEEETWEGVLNAIDKGLDPFKQLLRREVVRDDLIRLTEIKIKRISRYDSLRADEYLRSLEKEIEEVRKHLGQLTKYAIRYFENLLKKYGKGKERKTEIVQGGFDRISATEVVVANEQLYVDRKEGFVGYGMKKDELVCRCSTLDDIIVIRRDGVLVVAKVSEKAFLGKDIEHIAVFRKDEAQHLIYNLIYRDGRQGAVYLKRFKVGGVTRDKEYDLTKGTAGSRVLYLKCQLDVEEAPLVKVNLKPAPRLRKDTIEINFAETAVKGRSSNGNLVTKNTVRNVARIPKTEQEAAENAVAEAASFSLESE
jgi:topoisomerase IV subunit A